MGVEAGAVSVVAGKPPSSAFDWPGCCVHWGSAATKFVGIAQVEVADSLLKA